MRTENSGPDSDNATKMAKLVEAEPHIAIRALLAVFKDRMDSGAVTAFMYLAEGYESLWKDLSTMEAK